MSFTELVEDVSSKHPGQKIAMFVDMVGVLVETYYENGIPHQRPIYDTIKLISSLRSIPNLDLFILSSCNTVEQSQIKNNWLDNYASFFKQDNRYFIIKEVDKYADSEYSYMKGKYIKKILIEKHYDMAFYIDDNTSMLVSAKSILGDKITCIPVRLLSS